MSTHGVRRAPAETTDDEDEQRERENLLRRSRLVREPAMSDYYVIEDEWNRYKAAEIAYIENVLPHEEKARELASDLDIQVRRPRPAR